MQRRRPSRRIKRSRDAASILGVLRGKIGGPADARRRNFPICKPLKMLKMAKESGRPPLLAPVRTAVQGNAASDSSGFIPQAQR
jgi:hypothetical protein